MQRMHNSTKLITIIIMIKNEEEEEEEEDDDCVTSVESMCKTCTFYLYMLHCVKTVESICKNLEILPIHARLCKGCRIYL